MKTEPVIRVQAFRFALDPSPRQVEDLASHCGAVRFAYNHMLHLARAVLDQRDAESSYGIPEELRTPHLGWSAYDLRKVLNERKRQHAPWWRDVSKEAFSSGCTNLARALANFRTSRGGARSGKRVGFPRFKLKNGHASCTFTTGNIRINDDRRSVTLPRLGRIHTHEKTSKLHLLLSSGAARITTATVSLHRGRWFVSFVAHVAKPVRRHPAPGSIVGIDVGVSNAIVAATPDGIEISRMRLPGQMSHLMERRRTLQRRNRRRRSPSSGVAPSKRWERGQAQISRLDGRIANIRENAIHHMTTDLARRFETVVIEDLNVAGMLTSGDTHKRGLNRAIANASFGEIHRQLAYKTSWESGALVKAGRFFPSSKMCSGCGVTKVKLPLSERNFNCSICGARRDRDLNAAINLARLGGNIAGSGPVTGRGAMRKTKTLTSVLAAGREASTPLGDRL